MCWFWEFIVSSRKCGLDLASFTLEFIHFSNSYECRLIIVNSSQMGKKTFLNCFYSGSSLASCRLYPWPDELPFYVFFFFKLPGVEACENYTFRYGRNPLMELPLAVNPTGCARSEPKMSAHVKRFVLRYLVSSSHSTAQGF